MTSKSDDEDYDSSDNEEQDNSAVSEPSSVGDKLAVQKSGGRGKTAVAPAKKRGQNNSQLQQGGGSGQAISIGANGALQYQTANGKLDFFKNGYWSLDLLNGW